MIHRKLSLKTFNLFNFVLFALSAAPAFAQVSVSVATPIIEREPAMYRFTGTITSARNAEVSPRVAGLVAEADADIGFVARKGEPLLSLDDTLAKIDLEEMQVDLEAAREELANAKRLLDEAVGLGDNNFPRSERENRETNYRKAKLKVGSQEIGIKKQMEIVERHKILAPFDGVVWQKNTEVGEWVQTGRSVLSFVDTENLRLDLQVSQEQLNVVINSKTVKVSVAGFSHLSFDADIETRSPLVDSRTRTFVVRCRLDHPPSFIKPGMSAEALFQPKNEKPKLLITRDAILRDGDSSISVWVAVTSGNEIKASKRVVTTGSTNGDYIEITNGLNPEERVIYQGNESLQEGQVLRVVDSVNPFIKK